MLMQSPSMPSPPAKSGPGKPVISSRPVPAVEPLNTLHLPDSASQPLPPRASSPSGRAVLRPRTELPGTEIANASPRPTWRIEHVQAWALQGDPSENRPEARKRIEAWTPGSVLRLNELWLKNLPPLPDIEKLDASDNEIAAVRPEELPDSLTCVDLNHNLLTQPPSRWPAGVKVIELDDNHLIHAESDWPAALKELSVSGNPLLAALPGNLPDSVEEIYAERNPAMNHWPQRLPANLGKLNVDDTALPAPDAPLPVNLKRLLARRSHFTHLSEVLLQLSDRCYLYLEGHRLPEAEVQKVRDHMAADGYKGPHFHFNEADYGGSTPSALMGP
jgi:hypothetical protein